MANQYPSFPLQLSMDEVYKFLDKNEDGSVSMAEFVEAFAKPLAEAEAG